MKPGLFKIILSGIFLFFILKILFFWLLETTDSFFFYEFAQFMKTGEYFVPHPFYWRSPSTISPPAYCFFIYLITNIPRADVWIHAFQVILTLGSGYFLFRIIAKLINRSWAYACTLLYLLIPAHFFQSALMMTESFALFAVGGYIYFAFLVLEGKKYFLMKYWILYSACIVLIRYNLITLFCAALFLYFIYWMRKMKEKKLNGFPLIMDTFFALISLCVLIGWIITNHSLNGTWGLSDQTNKNFYDRIVGGDKLAPKADNPDWIYLKQSVGENVDLFQPTYNIEPALKLVTDNTQKDNEIFGHIAFAALRAHPFQYVQKTLINMLLIHNNGMPYAELIYRNTWWIETKCRILSTIHFCEPVIKTGVSFGIWNFFVSVSEWYYRHIPLVTNLFILFPALIFALIRNNRILRFTAITYIVSVGTVVLSETPIYRYLYPLYIPKFILGSYFITYIVSKILKRVQLSHFFPRR